MPARGKARVKKLSLLNRKAIIWAHPQTTSFKSALNTETLHAQVETQFGAKYQKIILTTYMQTK